MRYFLVFFKASNTKQHVQGCEEMVTQDQEYLSKSDLDYHIKRQGFDSVVYTNIIELTREEFKDWKK